MTLCEIGNTHYHFKQNGRIWKTPVAGLPEVKLEADEAIYVISVNEVAERKLARKYRTFSLEPFISLDSIYHGLGVDRAAACMAVDTGVIVDAGSAITVDVMRDSVHLGGFIYPGLTKFKEMYARISPRLQKAMTFSLDLESLPQSTGEAISFGVVMPLVSAVKALSRNKQIYLTGGDGAYFARYFEGTIVDQLLVFKGMERIIANFEGVFDEKV
ncbi:MAG: type III pantothenate kinase [Helicobacteraceae bacterium]|jgi:type III pantothenate kinase|nr:type III pantothenate kinase [Helicobacteraceae bacterium]